MVDADPVNPMRIVWEMSQRLPDDAIVTADSGSVGQLVRAGAADAGEMRGSLSGTLATMGAGVPYAIGAKFAHPRAAGRRVDGRRRDADERAWPSC